MKSLKIIQVLSKIAKILCTVLFIVCIVGASCCALAVILLPIFKDTVIYENKSFSIIIAENGSNYMTAFVGSLVGLIVCSTGIFLSKYTELFFEKELELGTPFNKELVKDMRKMALVHIFVSLGIAILLAILVGCFKLNYPELDFSNDDHGGTIGFGIAMLIISLFCDYGAELSTTSADNKEDGTIE